MNAAIWNEKDGFRVVRIVNNWSVRTIGHAKNTTGKGILYIKDDGEGYRGLPDLAVYPSIDAMKDAWAALGLHLLSLEEYITEDVLPEEQS